MKNRKKYLFIIFALILLILICLFVKNNKNNLQKNGFFNNEKNDVYNDDNLYFKDLSDISIEDFYANVDSNTNIEYSSISININSNIISGKYMEYKDGITFYFLPKYDNDNYSYTYEVMGNDNNIYFEGGLSNDNFYCNTSADISSENKNYICNDIENKLNNFIYDINKEIFEKNIIYRSNNKRSGSKVRIVCFVILLILSVVTYLLHKKVNSDSV